jgi:hypothetical protein
MSVATADRTGWRGRLGTRAGVALVLSVGVNGALVLVADALAVAPGFQPLAVPPVAFLSAVGVVGAALVYLALGRLSDRPVRQFRLLAGAVLVLSFVPDFVLLPGTEGATALGIGLLLVMHVVVAVVCVALLPEGAR